MAFSLETKTATSVEEYDVGVNQPDTLRSSALGGTQNDAHDMYRMGKTQELRVCCCCMYTRVQLNLPEKLPPDFDCRICCHPSVHMGKFTPVCYSR